MANHILNLTFEGQPETHCEPPGRDYFVPANTPIADLRLLGRRLAQCTGHSERALRAWARFIQRNGLFQSSSLSNSHRATLLLIQDWVNTKFTASGEMTAAFRRELKADSTFEWDTLRWRQKWCCEMTAEEQIAYDCPYDRRVHG